MLSLLARPALAHTLTRTALASSALATRRTFLTSARLAFPAAAKTKARATATKSKAKPAAKKTTAKKKPAAKKATVAKKKPAPKKKKVAAKKKAAPKKKKAPAKPKRIVVKPEDKPPGGKISGYTVFCKKQTEGVKLASNAEFQALGTETAKAWHALSDSEKQAFIEQAKVHNESIEQARVKWYETTPPEIIREINRRRVKRGAHKVTKPLAYKLEHKKATPPFVLFCMAWRTTHAETIQGQGNKVAEVGRAAAAEWKKLSEAEKKPYIDQWEAQKKSLAAARKL